MEKAVEHMTVDELQKRMQRMPTPKEAISIKENVKIFENIDRKISIKDGFKFLKDLRKEARRQKAMMVAERFEEQAKVIENVPDVPLHAAERQLADSFEIYEED